MTDCLECSNGTACGLCSAGFYFDGSMCAALSDGVTAFFESNSGEKVECIGGCQ